MAAVRGTLIPHAWKPPGHAGTDRKHDVAGQKEPNMTSRDKPRLIIVSNRLPINLVKEGERIVARESVGGLVTGLGAYLESLDESSPFGDEFIWVGWPGMHLDEDADFDFSSKIMGKFSIEPVNISEEDMDKFYHGFCNATLWPLFHYFPSYVVYEEELWEAYVKVNRLFFETVNRVARPGDVIWIHDYQIMLLPGMIRETTPGAAIGFFLHIPFPSYEMFRTLSVKWRSEILKGLLGSDLIGFHTYDYAQHFLNSVSSILGLDHHLGAMTVGERLVKADAFPMGIDFGKYAEAAKNSEVQRKKTNLRKALHGVKTILSIDRLDYSKGILHRLRGFELFLERYPAWREKVVLMLVVVPSRTGVSTYQTMKKQIDERVGFINGKYGALSWQPIIYQYNAFGLDDLAMLYDASDVALVTPLRDGMNLVAKEYIAAKTDGKGALILSEMAGAANEMGEAIVITPYNAMEIADAIKEALDMDEAELVRKNALLKERLKRFDVNHWAEDFMDSLLGIKTEQGKFESRFVTPQSAERIVAAYKGASRRLLLLDYDGTLIPFADGPDKAEPTKEILDILKALCADPANDVAIFSGSPRAWMEKWLGGLPAHLVAEHGVWLRTPGGEWRMIKPLLNDWMVMIRPILTRFCSRLPGSYIEEKEYSIAWHYRNSAKKLGEIRSRELVETLKHLAANMDIQVISDNRVVEVRSAGINKAVAGLHLMSEGDFDFTLALGDADTDEDLFRALPGEAVSIRVGMVNSHAAYNVRNIRAALVLLRNFILNGQER